MTTKRNQKNAPSPKKLWKILFLLLLALNLGTTAFVASRVFIGRDQSSLKSVSRAKSDSKVATINSDTAQVNTLINGYLQTYQTKQMSYKFYLSDKAVLEASYQLFGQKIPLYVYFEPLALNDGSVSLAVQSVSVGTLSLPTSTVLSYIKAAVKLPDFVEVEASKSQIIVHLPALSLGQNLYLKANVLDTSEGKFSFDLMKKA